MKIMGLIALTIALVASSRGDEAKIESGKVIRDSLAAYHTGAKANGALLRIVYFHPAGVKPQADYGERLQRIMLDDQAFLKDEMARYGFENAVLPLEIAAGKLRIHMVEGKEGADGYSHESGNKVKAEIRDALKGTFALHEAYVLVFHGMCRIDGERKYYFYAPYYGDRGSNHQRGLCHVADCEILDPALLTDVKRSMSYKEHYGDYKHSVAGFNTKYLGGVIHELGHGLGLPHNGQTQAEMKRIGTALMGAGNHTYRRERWSKRKGSFLTFASAVRLASHPLFTGSDRGRKMAGKSSLEGLRFAGTGTELAVSGKVSGSPDVYAVIAYLDPDGGADYDAVTTVSPLNGGSFSLDLSCVKSGAHQLRLAVCHVNGAVSLHRFTLTTDASNEPDRAGIAQKKMRRK